MLQLTASQYEALNNLVEGNGRPIDGRVLAALQRRGLVNKHGHATTRGWHTTGRFRYMPETKIVPYLELESYQGYVIVMSEGPHRTDYDEDGNLAWHRAEHVDYFLDFYKMANWYSSVQRRIADVIESMWDSNLDLDVDHFGYDANRLLTIRRAALEQALYDDPRYYTNQIFYDAVAANLGRGGRYIQRVTTSFKYSLQDNEDEFKDWLTTPRTNPPLSWRVEVD